MCVKQGLLVKWWVLHEFSGSVKTDKDKWGFIVNSAVRVAFFTRRQAQPGLIAN